MHTYRITFASDNKILMVKPVKGNYYLQGEYYYYEYGGLLVYGVVKAANEAAARNITESFIQSLAIASDSIEAR